MNYAELIEFFDGARFVRVEGDKVFVWFGGPTIQICTIDDGEMQPDDAFTLYPCDEKDGSRHPTYLEVHDSVLKHIEDEKEEEEANEMCGNCNGSGEGMYDGSTCSSCGGAGETQGSRECDDYEPPEPDYDLNAEVEWESPI